MSDFAAVRAPAHPGGPLDTRRSHCGRNFPRGCSRPAAQHPRGVERVSADDLSPPPMGFCHPRPTRPRKGQGGRPLRPAFPCVSALF